MKLSDKELRIIKESLERRAENPEIDELLQKVSKEISKRDVFLDSILRCAGLEEL